MTHQNPDRVSEHRRRRPRRLARIAVVGTVLLVFGCSSMGPRTVKLDRFDYNSAIAVSANEQLLLNLVRLRYGESILLLDVGQVISQYKRTGNASIGAEAGFKSGAGVPGDNILIPEVGMTWSETPTITYAPRTGSAFTRSLLTPISPIAVFALIQSDWPEELVMRRVVRSINGVASQSSRTGDWNPRYGEMMRALTAVQGSGACGLATVKVSGSLSTKGKSMVSTKFRFRDVETDEETAMAIRKLREMWNLSEDVHDYDIVLGVIPDNPNELAILTNSVMDVLRDLSAYIDVPSEHVADGRTLKSRMPPPESAASGPPIHVRVSQDRPSNAYVRIEKNGWWYYIAETDLASKQIFSLISILLNLAEAGPRKSGPVVTINTGS